MATTKKSTTTAKRKTSQKARKTSKHAHAVVYRTFQVAPDFPTFLQPRVSKQTFYWSLLLLFIIIMQLIILAINIDASITFDIRA